MSWIVLLGRLLLAAVFVIAAAGKLADRRGARQALAEFGVPHAMTAPLALLLPLAELATAALLLSGAARTGAAAALGLLAIFVVAVAVSLARGRKPDCHCFGQLHSAPIGASTLSRNGALALVAALVLWRGDESPASAAGVGVATWIALAVASVALAVAAIEAWLLLHMLPQQGSLLRRVAALEVALGQEHPTGLPVGERAPEFALRSLAGERVSLAALRSTGRPVLLIFTNPDCPPCDALLPDVARWQREEGGRVEVVVIGRGPLEANREKAERHGLRAVLVQRKREVGEAYRIDATPAAVLVGAEGRIASPIADGAERIERLLREAGGATEQAPSEPVPAGSGNGRHPPTPRVGDPAPALVLPDLEGKATDLAALRGGRTLVLFWSPSCGFCQGMLSELKAWERKRPARAPRLLLVSTGTAEANRAMGLASPIVLDRDGAGMRAFGASGTPMGVLVDTDGRIASPLAVGAERVMALVRERRDEAATA